MTFIEGVSGELYSIELIERIRLPEGASKHDMVKHWQRECSVTLRSGEIVAIEYGKVLSLLNSPTHIVPALPGTSMLTYDGQHGDVFNTSVVAWAYTRDGEFLPVTASGVGYNNSTAAVRGPEGLVGNDAAGWPSEDAWRAYAIDSHLADKAI